jgi:hypothetical protein
MNTLKKITILRPIGKGEVESSIPSSSTIFSFDFIDGYRVNPGPRPRNGTRTPTPARRINVPNPCQAGPQRSCRVRAMGEVRRHGGR